MKKNIRKENAITLVSLVVTIIVMLILAGISVTAILGNNKLIGRAGDARDNTNKAKIIEQTRLGIKTKSLEKKGKRLTDAELRTILEKHFSDVNKVDEFTDEIIESESIFLTSKKGNYEITLKELLSGLKMFEDTSIRIGETDISEVDDLSPLYGEDTNYKSIDDITWQLFYDDDDNVYLIASDYVPEETLPSELLTENQYSTYCRSFATSETDTTSTIPAGDPWRNASTASTVQNNPYLKWVGSSADTVRTNLNMKAVAFMLDTSKWSHFSGNARGATVTGAPTIEMYALSYNAKHDTKLGTYETITNFANADSDGYRVKYGENGWSSNTSGLDTSSDNMWVKTDSSKATGMWIASPSSDLPCNAIYIHYTGILSPYPVHCALHYYNDVGFRPVITVPKPSLKQ